MKGGNWEQPACAPAELSAVAGAHGHASVPLPLQVLLEEQHARRAAILTQPACAAIMRCAVCTVQASDQTMPTYWAMADFQVGRKESNRSGAQQGQGRQLLCSATDCPCTCYVPTA